jgi:hypothetical protein
MEPFLQALGEFANLILIVLFGAVLWFGSKVIKHMKKSRRTLK